MKIRARVLLVDGNDDADNDDAFAMDVVAAGVEVIEIVVAVVAGDISDFLGDGSASLVDCPRWTTGTLYVLDITQSKICKIK